MISMIRFILDIPLFLSLGAVIGGIIVSMLVFIDSWLGHNWGSRLLSLPDDEKEIIVQREELTVLREELKKREEVVKVQEGKAEYEIDAIDEEKNYLAEKINQWQVRLNHVPEDILYAPTRVMLASVANSSSGYRKTLKTYRAYTSGLPDKPAERITPQIVDDLRNSLAEEFKNNACLDYVLWVYKIRVLAGDNPLLATWELYMLYGQR